MTGELFCAKFCSSKLGSFATLEGQHVAAHADASRVEIPAKVLFGKLN